MGKDICKSHIQKEVNIQNIYKDLTQEQQQQTNKKPDLKMGGGSKYIFPKKTYRWPIGKQKDVQHH